MNFYTGPTATSDENALGPARIRREHLRQVRSRQSADQVARAAKTILLQNADSNAINMLRAILALPHLPHSGADIHREGPTTQLRPCQPT